MKSIRENPKCVIQLAKKENLKDRIQTVKRVENKLLLLQEILWNYKLNRYYRKKLIKHEKARFKKIRREKILK
jgi:hypothetical protein